MDPVARKRDSQREQSGYSKKETTSLRRACVQAATESRLEGSSDDNRDESIPEHKSKRKLRNASAPKSIRLLEKKFVPSRISTPGDFNLSDISAITAGCRSRERIEGMGPTKSDLQLGSKL